MRRKSKAVRFLEELVGPLTFASLIEAHRLGEELTLQAFATKLGVSRSHLCDVEKGRRTVSVERAARWARVLEMSELQFVQLALQGQLDAAGLALEVSLEKTTAPSRPRRRPPRRPASQP